MKVKQDVTFHAPSKKALDRFVKEFGHWLEDWKDSGDSPAGVFYSLDNPPEADPDQ